MTPSQSPAHPLGELDAPDEKTEREAFMRLLEHVDAWPGTADYHGLPKWVGRLNELRIEARSSLASRPGRAEPTELEFAARNLLNAARSFGKPPNRHAYTTSGLGPHFEALAAALSQGAQK